MTGLGPWLELPDDATREGALRAKMRVDVIKAIDSITRPDSPDRMPFEKPGAVRGALTAVLRRQTGPENFLPGGWLRVGFNGEQQMLAEGYIDYGSVYMCAAVFLPLGLPADSAFWTEPESDWTQRAAWSGRPARIDHRF